MVGLSLCALKMIGADVCLSLLFCAAIPRPPPGDIHKNSGLVFMYAHAYLCMHTFVGVRVVWSFGCVCMRVRVELYWVSTLQHCRDG